MLEYHGIAIFEDTTLIKPVIYMNAEFVFTGSFMYQPLVCNGCHDLLQKSMSFDDVAIVTGGRNHYRVKFWFMTKSEVVVDNYGKKY